MSVATHCNTYWVNLEYVVIEHDRDVATCDSTLTSCTLMAANGGTLDVTCDSTLQVSGLASTDYASYFCACGSHTVYVPSTVTCADLCYDLSYTFPKCNWLTLYDGYTSGSASIGVTEDLCEVFRCGKKGVRCTDKGQFLYLCDNAEHETPYISSTDLYVCNCHGPATIPEFYRGSSKKTHGTSCSGGAIVRAVSASNATSSTTASSPSVAPSASKGVAVSFSLTRSLLGMALVLMLIVAN